MAESGTDRERCGCVAVDRCADTVQPDVGMARTDSSARAVHTRSTALLISQLVSLIEVLDGDQSWRRNHSAFVEGRTIFSCAVIVEQIICCRLGSFRLESLFTGNFDRASQFFERG